ncbi:NADPH-dependent FMN reductase [soil metagenome]
MKRILGISGSTKSNSTNERILRAVARMYSGELDIEVFTGIDTIPHFNPDLDNDEPPAAVAAFRKLIDEADGILISTPEYVFSLPGALKNALEWLVSTTILTDKPAAFIVAAASGEKAFDSLALILRTVGAKIDNESMLLIKAAKAKVNFDNEITDESTRAEIDRVMAAFKRS